MAEYETEEQQVEALKQWWSENGRQILFGIGLGVALIFGYRMWQAHKLNVSEDASSQYTKVMESLEQKDGEEFLKLVGDLRKDNAGSPYATLASLAEARFQVENDRLPEAESALRWALDKGAYKEYHSLTRIRLARVLRAQDKHDEALELLDKVTASSFAGHVEEIRGDIYLDQGNTTEAAAAYQRALGAGDTRAAGVLQMKIDDLAVPGTATTDDQS